ncbi:MAG: peptidoglycan-associated lipoprotein Pal [Oligoflexales bacterium]
MVLKYRVPFFGMVLVAMSLFLGNCTDDEQPEETVEASQPEVPATPPEDSLGDAAGDATKPVYFAFDDYTLNSDAQGQLNRLADFLKSSTSAIVQIEGHCDERGSIEYNLALGERRAQSVKNYLVQLGVDTGRLTTISYGEEKPVTDGHEEGAWSQNRRAEFAVSNR